MLKCLKIFFDWSVDLQYIHKILSSFIRTYACTHRR